MNEKAMQEIADLIHIKYSTIRDWWKDKKITPQQLIETPEYKMFKEAYPVICSLAEGVENSKDKN